MSYERTDESGGYIKLVRLDGRPVILVDEDVKDGWSSMATATLPTDPVEVETLVRGVLEATGCELSYSTSRTDFGLQGRPGGVRVVKRDQ